MSTRALSGFGIVLALVLCYTEPVPGDPVRMGQIAWATGGKAMEGGSVATRPKLFRIKTVRGEPYIVGERKLVPVVRVISFGKARATVGADQVTGWGTAFARITPLAVLEETDDGERRIAVRDRTATTVRGMLLAAVVSTFFFTTIRCLVRLRRRSRAR